MIVVKPALRSLNDIPALCDMKSKMTLDRVLSRFGLASRTVSRQAIWRAG